MSAPDFQAMAKHDAPAEGKPNGCKGCKHKHAGSRCDRFETDYRHAWDQRCLGTAYEPKDQVPA